MRGYAVDQFTLGDATMSANVLLWLMAIVSGALIPVQAASNAALARMIGAALMMLGAFVARGPGGATFGYHRLVLRWVGGTYV
jgi:hypothetical protein